MHGSARFSLFSVVLRTWLRHRGLFPIHFGMFVDVIPVQSCVVLLVRLQVQLLMLRGKGGPP